MTTHYQLSFPRRWMKPISSTRVDVSDVEALRMTTLPLYVMGFVAIAAVSMGWLLDAWWPLVAGVAADCIIAKVGMA
jgi:hypothetical protein